MQLQGTEQPVAPQRETNQADRSVTPSPAPLSNETESAEQQPTPVDTDPKSPTTEPSNAPPTETMKDAEPTLSEWSSTQTMVENEGRPRPKRPREDSKPSTSAEDTSAQLSAIADKAPDDQGVPLSSDWKGATEEETLPTMELRESDTNPMNRRADRLERDKRSGRDELDPSEASASESQSDSEGPASRLTDDTTTLALQPDASWSGLANIPTEVVTAGFTEASAAGITSTSPQMVVPPAITTPSSIDSTAATAAGTTASNGLDPTSTLGASFSSTNDGQRVGSSERSQAGASSVRGPLTPYQESKLVQRVMRGFEQLSEGGGQVRLRLHPPELGTLQMTLRIESMQVFAKLEVETTVARDALVQNAQALKDQLAAQGFEVERFEVEIRSEVGGDSSGTEDRSDRQGENPRWRTLESRYAAMQSNRINESPRDPQTPPARTPWFRNGNNLDLTV